MDLTIFPKKLHGTIAAIPSKSQAHRLFVCAALADQQTSIEIPILCDDLLATTGCLSGFGAKIQHHYGKSETVIPISASPDFTVVNCGESGATLRFMLPLAGALGIETLFLLEGRLPYRPLSPLWEEMERNGCHLSWVNRNQLLQELVGKQMKLPRSVTAGLRLTGKLRPGHYRIDGNVSSQFISGLLMALPLLDGASHLELVGKVESTPYIDMTLEILSKFGVHWQEYHISGKQKFKSPSAVAVEGDWSNGAFWLAAGALGSDVAITGLNPDSVQGDREIAVLLPLLQQENRTISAADIPDLIPILAVIAAANKGAVFTDVRRLRMKESDRVASVVSMINSLGGHATADENTLTVFPSRFIGGTVDAMNDHRIAMAAAIVSTVCRENVTILGAECVNKSYPSFWKEFTRLGGEI